MAQNPWIIEKWLPARERMQIGSAHPDAMNPHEGVAGEAWRFGAFLDAESAGLLEYDLKHGRAKGFRRPPGHGFPAGRG
jgi:hypothetical protein